MRYLILILMLLNSVINAQQVIDLCRGSNIQTYYVDGYLGSTYTWYLDGQLLNDSSDLVTIQFRDDTLGNYALEVREITEFGCLGEIRKLNIRIKPCFTLYIPNTITINRDGLNDKFRLHGEGWEFNTFVFTIHNRWGQEIFRSYTPFFEWNGRHNNLVVPQGVYTYSLTFTQNKIPYYGNELGHINVIR
jgi:gliding motility-associated-like protein